MYSLNQKKSNFSNLKFLIPLLLVVLLNVNCDHCDEEDLTREEEEVITAKHEQTVILNQKI